MYKDEMWYRNWSRAVDAHKEDMTDKQWQKFNIVLMLKLGRRVKDFSDKCKTCRDYQHPLTRLEEEMGNYQIRKPNVSIKQRYWAQ